MKKFYLLISLILFTMILSDLCNSQIVTMFTGKYTGPGEKGLNIFDVNIGSGTMTLVSESDAGPNPAYLAISGRTGLIYAANEVSEFNGIKGGGVTTLKFDSRTGSAKKLNELAVPNGGPCYISLSDGDNFLFLANYGGGSVAVVKLNDQGIPETVTDNIIFEKEGENSSHAHMISPDPAGKRVYVTDLGLDRIVVYSLDQTTGKLSQTPNGIVKLPKGAGPRHFVFSPDGTKMYVICELSSAIYVFNIERNGDLTQIQSVSTLAEGFKGENACADIHIRKSGKYLYGSNRGENTIVTFNVLSDGTLSLAGRTPCGGNWPRNFVIDPTGNYILVGNQRSGNISLLKINETTGIPGESVKDFKLATPACLKFSF
jgi:6-phosphogluconolactonase